jgi:DNA polymerase III subunit epsilon
VNLLSLSRFAVIDFETANRSPASACALSLVNVNGNEATLILSEVLLTNETNFDFEPLHGISRDCSLAGRKFEDLWPTLESTLRAAGHCVVAHNASFDRRVLESCLRRARIRPPKLRYFCTMNLAQAIWGLRPATLPAVCAHLGIPLKHHDPASDAMAAAQIVIAARTEKLRRAIAEEQS